MKQKLFLGLSLLAIAGMWTACTNDEAMDFAGGQRAISFRTQGGMPEVTKATATTNDHIDAFVVYGSDTNGATTPVTVTLFDGETIGRKAGSTNTFTYNPLRYYSLDAEYANFVAYSPVSAKMAKGTDPTKTTFTYEVLAPDGATGKTTQEDLLIAGTKIKKDGFGKGSVKVNFEHALSRVFVKAKNEMKETVTITGLKLKNLYSKGTITGTPPTGYTLPDTGDPMEYYDHWTWAWTVTADTKTDYSYALAQSGGIAVKTMGSSENAVLVTSMEQGMMVLPQVVANTADDPTAAGVKDFALEVTYSVGNLTGQVAYVFLKKKDATPNTFEFVPGKQYAITVNFGGSSTPELIQIGFDVSVSDFTNDTTML